MGKMKVDKELLKDMEDYTLFMDAAKEISTPVVISQEKPNHKSSLYVEGHVNSSHAFGNVKYGCEMRDKREDNFSIQLTTDKFGNKVLFRIDQGNGTHRNNLPTIPLAAQSVPTPHFHRFCERGYFYAYQTDVLKQNENMNIQDGLAAFCSEVNVKGSANNAVEIVVRQDGVLPLEEDKDPLNGINF